MSLRWAIRPGAYYDSVRLMQISARAAAMDGVRNASAVMATPMNLDTLRAVGLYDETFADASPNDLIIAVEADSEEAAEGALAAIEQMLTASAEENRGSGSQEEPPRSVEQAVLLHPEANVALISVPGTYAAYEAGRCLRQGLHVHLFSDNVSIEDEILLKRLASERGLLLMGPDCGTSILSGRPLAFANVVRRGSVGIVGASGTGIQAVSVLVDRFGAGISHAIGTGGRDVKDDVGGIMFLAGIQALEEDPGTEVMVLVSKPPGERTAARIMNRVASARKPTVVCLLGGDPIGAAWTGAHVVSDLEAAAQTAAALALGKAVPDLHGPRPNWAEIVSRMTPAQRFLRGLYSGGTLCDETMLILRDHGLRTWSNTPVKGGFQLESGRISREHTVVDLGDDEFTRGKPHPMIDPSTRAQRIVEELTDPSVAVLILDVVLGYGSHPDPAGAVAEAIQAGRKARADGDVCVIASVCGTENDPQDLRRQEAVLREAGVLVYPSNASAARAAIEALTYVERRTAHV